GERETRGGFGRRRLPWLGGRLPGELPPASGHGKRGDQHSVDLGVDCQFSGGHRRAVRRQKMKVSFIANGVVICAWAALAQSPGTFTATGSMTAPRAYHTA